VQQHSSLIVNRLAYTTVNNDSTFGITHPAYSRKSLCRSDQNGTPNQPNSRAKLTRKPWQIIPQRIAK
ncbi:MAG: hypothetical protein II245_05805, partial [Bacteroidaceae bacterium]|nr:hypothetical protein [Bacteroidaceae bacterium]